MSSIVSLDRLRAVPEDADRNKGVYKSLEFLYRIEKYPVIIMQYFMVFGSLALGVLMTAQVILRYVLKLPFLGIEELAPLLALWAYFLGMGYSARTREHVMGGILTLVCKKPAVVKTIRLLGSIGCCVVVFIFGFYALKMGLFNMSLGRLSIYMRFPKYLWDFSLVAGFVLSGFYFILQIILETLDLVLCFKN